MNKGDSFNSFLIHPLLFFFFVLKGKCKNLVFLPATGITVPHQRINIFCLHQRAAIVTVPAAI